MIANVDFVTLWNSFLTTVEGVTNVTGLFPIAAYVGLVIFIGFTVGLIASACLHTLYTVSVLINSRIG